jgi:hypothetical protein
MFQKGDRVKLKEDRKDDHMSNNTLSAGSEGIIEGQASADGEVFNVKMNIDDRIRPYDINKLEKI